MIPKYNTSLTGIGETTIWDGTSWDNGAPNKNMVAVIQGVYNTGTHGDISCLDLFLNSGSLTVTINTIVKVFRNIQQQSGFVFNVINGELALLNKDVDTSSVKITISRDLEYQNQRLDYRILTDPIGNKTLKTFSPQTVDNRFYRQNSPTNQWLTTPGTLNIVSLGTDVSNTIYKPGMGFLIRTPNNFSTSPTTWTLSTTTGNSGKLNSGVIKTSIEKAPLNFPSLISLANPYAASIDIKKFLEANPFLNKNFILFWLKTNSTNGTAYYDSNQYESSGYMSYFPSKIKPFEGFIAELPFTEEPNDVIFTPDMMVIDEPFDLLSSFNLNIKINSSDPIPIGSCSFVWYHHPVNFINISRSLSTTGYRILLNDSEVSSNRLSSFSERNELNLLLQGGNSYTLTLVNRTNKYLQKQFTLVDNVLGVSHDLLSGSCLIPFGSSYPLDRFKLIIQ
jgi:hypothetical protein